VLTLTHKQGASSDALLQAIYDVADAQDVGFCASSLKGALRRRLNENADTPSPAAPVEFGYALTVGYALFGSSVPLDLFPDLCQALLDLTQDETDSLAAYLRQLKAKLQGVDRVGDRAPPPGLPAFAEAALAGASITEPGVPPNRQECASFPASVKRHYERLFTGRAAPSEQGLMRYLLEDAEPIDPPHLPRTRR
jgi:hypothetical protein